MSQTLKQKKAVFIRKYNDFTSEENRQNFLADLDDLLAPPEDIVKEAEKVSGYAWHDYDKKNPGSLNSSPAYLIKYLSSAGLLARKKINKDDIRLIVNHWQEDNITTDYGGGNLAQKIFNYLTS